MRRFVCAAFVVSIPALGVAQQSLPDQTQASPLAFEVASIKPNDGSTPGGSLGLLPGGRYVAINQPLISLVRMAYPAMSRDVVGAPSWLTAERYDVNATAGREATRPEIQQMVKTLLDERLKLSAHVEEREQPVYNLVLARSDGRLGPEIRESAFDCDVVSQRARQGERVLADNGAPACGMSASGGVTRVGGQTLAILAASISGGSVGRIVIDKTGLTGRYEYVLKYSSNPERQTDDTPSLFTALQEQLGLKLEPSTAVVTVLVIDHVERPTPD
jgi:uncharacterized protein (TIGR03435 family)